MLESRGIETDVGPLLVAEFRKLAHSVYQSPSYVLKYAKDRRENGLDSYAAFLDEAAEAMIGPKESWTKQIEKNYQPGAFNLQSPGNGIRNYVLFLGHLVRDFELAGPVLVKAYGMNLAHPNEYQLQNNFENSVGSSKFRSQFNKAYQFLKESQFLGDLDNFRTYPMSNVYRNSALGYVLYGFGNFSSSNRTRLVAQIKNHQPDTFGKAMILAYVNVANSTSNRGRRWSRKWKSISRPFQNCRMKGKRKSSLGLEACRMVVRFLRRSGRQRQRRALGMRP
jgi:hypothetical protein